MATCKSVVCNPPSLRSIEVIPARKELIEKCTELIITQDQMQTYMKSFLDNIERGLKMDTHPTSIVKCFPTYVQNLPDGSETGKYLALDLGGSNFRVLLVELANKSYTMDQKIYSIPQETMTGPGEELFDFIATCLSEYTTEKGVNNDNLPLGFTFSFPLEQKGLKVGILERWTKGFSCDGVIGNDVVQLLEEAIARRGDVTINVAAVVNDTTGTLMACAFKDPNCKIGLIVGTGTNGCYVEKQSNAELFDEPDEGSGVVIINLESGAFGDDGALDFCRTQYDIDVDANSINPGKQLHEKMISGMYLGELVRLAAVRFTNEGIMFGGTLSDDFNTPDKFETKFVSEIESDPPGNFTKVKEICDSLGMTDATEQDYNDLKYLCQCFSRRAAVLVSCLITTLIRKMQSPQTTVGIDGTLYKNHPHFHDIIMQQVSELLQPDPYTCKVMLSEDGSGIGAALIAALAVKGGDAPDAGEGGEEGGEGGGEEGGEGEAEG
ncbi:hexokinase type 2-like [Diorhabda sublineata]|uniref:hexokinase type 2-like n=1 Tax=Diorhabda sublineata TaxID=1163346 RepID=UPI0024E11F2F|nr:hexokinase type 2-like [Diorhabda sublineata]